MFWNTDWELTFGDMSGLKLSSNFSYTVYVNYD